MNTPHHPSQKPPRDVNAELKKIYSDRDGRLPDLHRLSRKSSSRFQSFLLKTIVVLGLISLISWGGFFFFSKGSFQKNETLKTMIEGPTTIKAGEKISYKILYENIGSVPIASLQMTMSLPSSFHLINTFPLATEKNTWNLGSLTPSSDGSITIQGLYLSEVPSSERVQALFTYKPANFNSSFQDIQTFKTDIADSVVQLVVNGPEKAQPGEDVEYLFTISHTQQEPLFNLEVHPLIPQNFLVKSTNPSLDSSTSVWSVPQLDQKYPKTFSLKGAFTSSSSEEETVGASVGFLQDDLFLKQRELFAGAEIVGGSIAYQLNVNGINTDQPIDAGKLLHTSIRLQNNGTETASDITVSLLLDGKSKSLPIDWEKADLKNGKKTGDQITWDISTLPSLKSLKPKEEHTLDLILPIQTTLPKEVAETFSMKLLTSMKQLGSFTDPKPTESTPILFSLNSPVVFTSEARYFTDEGQPVGSGALPPQVNKSTTYRLYFNIQNTLHDLTNILVSADLPKGTTWIDKKQTDIGEIHFNPTTRRVTWKIPKLLSSIPVASAFFDVSVVPTAKDVGSSLPLLSSASFMAVDTKTNGEITKSTDTLTSILATDAFAKNKGIVMKE